MVELLTVVTVIGVLAAIAIPNFLEAQTRSKISRARIEMAGIKLALADYYTDHAAYPPPPPMPEPSEGPETQQEVQPPSYPPYSFPPGMVPPGYPPVPYSATGPAGAPMPRPPPGGPWGYPYPPGQQPAPEEAGVPSPLQVLTSPVPYIPLVPMDPFRVTWTGQEAPYGYQLHIGENGEGLAFNFPGLRGIYLFTLSSYGPDQSGSTFFTESFVTIMVYDPSNGTTSDGDLLVPGP